MKKLLLLIPCVVALSACQPPLTREQQLAIYRSRCLEYGYQPGSVEFAKCMEKQEARETKLYMQEREIEAIEEQNWMEREKLRVKQDELTMKRNQQKNIQPPDIYIIEK
jgi:hypothetical protein